MTSFGLALATWMRRLGRAMAASVATYALIAFGWISSGRAGSCLGHALLARAHSSPDDSDARQFL